MDSDLLALQKFKFTEMYEGDKPSAWLLPQVDYIQYNKNNELQKFTRPEIVKIIQTQLGVYVRDEIDEYTTLCIVPDNYDGMLPGDVRKYKLDILHLRHVFWPKDKAYMKKNPPKRAVEMLMANRLLKKLEKNHALLTLPEHIYALGDIDENFNKKRFPAKFEDFQFTQVAGARGLRGRGRKTKTSKNSRSSKNSRTRRPSRTSRGRSTGNRYSRQRSTAGNRRSRRSRSRGDSPPLQAWRQAIKEAQVVGIPKKGTRDYKRVRKIYESMGF